VPLKVEVRARGLHDASAATFFRGGGSAYTGRRLYLRVAGRPDQIVGRADPYVRPLVTGAPPRVYFVQVRRTMAFPGAEWTLLSYDSSSGRTSVVARAVGMALLPLGESGRSFLYAVARETDTSVFSATRGTSRFDTILVTQPLTSAAMSPDGRFIAFTVPASCWYCTLDVFDTTSRRIWTGPSGLPSERAFAWSPNSQTLLAAVGARLEAIGPNDHPSVFYSLPAALPAVWPASLRLSNVGATVRLTDVLANRTYLAYRH